MFKNTVWFFTEKRNIHISWINVSYYWFKIFIDITWRWSHLHSFASCFTFFMKLTEINTFLYKTVIVSEIVFWVYYYILFVDFLFCHFLYFSEFSRHEILFKNLSVENLVHTDSFIEWNYIDHAHRLRSTSFLEFYFL